jgi:hypothetical protein
MVRLVRFVLTLVVLAVLAFLVHAGLVSLSQGQGTVAEQARATCSICHR